MNDEDKQIAREVVRGCLPVMVGWLIALLVCALLGGCRAAERVEVPVVVTESHHTEAARVEIVRDTLHTRDSVVTLIMGDTVIIERWHTTRAVQVVGKSDTLRLVDTVPVVAERVVTRTVARPLTWLQKSLIGIGAGTLIAAMLLLAWRLRKRQR